jgi:hypothetical protein
MNTLKRVVCFKTIMQHYLLISASSVFPAYALLRTLLEHSSALNIFFFFFFRIHLVLTLWFNRLLVKSNQVTFSFFLQTY